MQIERMTGHLPEPSSESATTDLPAFPCPQSPTCLHILSLACALNIVTYSLPGQALAGDALRRGLKGALPWFAAS